MFRAWVVVAGISAAFVLGAALVVAGSAGSGHGNRVEKAGGGLEAGQAQFAKDFSRSLNEVIAELLKKADAKQAK